MAPFTGAGNPPDAGGVYADTGLWQRLIDADVVPEIRDLFRNPYSAVAPDGDPNTDAWAIRYLESARNRLTGIPDEVYSQIVGEIDRGIREGRSIPDIASDIDQRLMDSDSARWASRAVTVARTETIGATNGGAFAGAVQRAAMDGTLDTAEKQWLATMDQRTRPAHQLADQQRVGLLEPFTVGGARMMFPGDPSGPADQVINCRCSLLSLLAGEEVDWTNRAFIGD